MPARRDVGVVLSGGGVNCVMMELGFLQRLHESELWPRIAVVFGTSAGALSGALAALDRLSDLEEFLMELQPQQAFRPNRLWRLPFLGLHDYVLPQTIVERFGDLETLGAELAQSPVELVVVATDVTDDHERPEDGYELVYSSRETTPRVLAQAVLASAAVSALVLPLRVGDRVATDGSWVRNFPLGRAYDHADVDLIVAFRYVSRYPRLGIAPLQRLEKRLHPFRRIAPIRAFLTELEEAQDRARRGEPAHLADMIVRLARVAIVRNTQLEERYADEKDLSLDELRALREDVLALIDEPELERAVDRRVRGGTLPLSSRSHRAADHRSRIRRGRRPRPGLPHAEPLDGRAEAVADSPRLGARPRAARSARLRARRRRPFALHCGQRGVAQPGRAPPLGGGSRQFESARPDTRLSNLVRIDEPGSRVAARRRYSCQAPPRRIGAASPEAVTPSTSSSSLPIMKSV
jgi:predicted acylesterase/phospholipase RssA